MKLNCLVIIASIAIYSVVNANCFESDELVEKKQHSNCTCVPYYQCSEESGNVITNGDGLLDLRKYQSTVCTGYFDVCCNIANVGQESTTEVSVNKGCGYLKQMTVPWSGVLLINKAKEQDAWEHKCGVSVIHNNAVLTAAHCLDDDLSVENYSVRIAQLSRKIRTILIHEHFNYGTLQNDVALLILENPLNIENICVPPPGSQIDSEGRRSCIVTTWKSNKLAVLELPIVNKSRCEYLLRKTRLGKFFQLHSSFVCAGGETQKDTCDGDGGSPLICPVPGQPGRFHQVGIVSWGIGCGENNTPGVYVNVAKFRDWIDDKLTEHSLDIKAYRY